MGNILHFMLWHSEPFFRTIALYEIMWCAHVSDKMVDFTLYLEDARTVTRRHFVSLQTCQA